MTNTSVNEILKKFETERTNLLPILHEINDTVGYIDRDTMQDIAEYLDISATEVYGTTTFYSFFNIKPKGKYVIRLCQSVSCDLAGKNDIVEALEDEIGIVFGETDPDFKFTLEFTNCMGMCDKGPAMLVNKEVYTNLTPEKIRDIVSGLK